MIDAPGGRLGGLGVVGCLAIAGAALSLLTAGYVGFGVATQEAGWSELEAASLTEAEVDALLEDQAAIAALRLFGELGHETDCGPLLNPLLSGSGEGMAAERQPWWREVDQDQVEEGWLKDSHVMPSGDFGLLEEAMTCDHWDISSSGPFARYASDPPELSVMELPVPVEPDLHLLARLRVSSALRGELPLVQALAEVHHLGVLLTAEENLFIQAAGFGLLKVEADASGAAIQEGLLDEADSRALSAAKQARLRRAAFAMAAVYSGLAPEGSMERLASSQGPLFGHCVALAEGLKAGALVRTTLDSPWPLERDHTAWLGALDEALERSGAEGGCRLSLELVHWEHPEWSEAALFTEEDGSVSAPGSLSRLPWFRQGTASGGLAAVGGAFVNMSRQQR